MLLAIRNTIRLFFSATAHGFSKNRSLEAFWLLSKALNKSYEIIKGSENDLFLHSPLKCIIKSESILVPRNSAGGNPISHLVTYGPPHSIEIALFYQARQNSIPLIMGLFFWGSSRNYCI